MTALAASSGLSWSTLIGGMGDGIRPFAPLLIGLVIVCFALACPLPGRGPGSQSRDPWRGFRFEARRVVLGRAGERCEGSIFLTWGRCRGAAEEADHIYPWSKGGATVVSNGQALCRRHNSSKSNRTPPWWYVLSLERRRRTYFPAGDDVRVAASRGDADRAARRAWAERKKQGR